MAIENDILGFDPQSLSVFNTEEKQPKSQGNPLIYKTRPADSVSDDGHVLMPLSLLPGLCNGRWPCCTGELPVSKIF